MALIKDLIIAWVVAILLVSPFAIWAFERFVW